MIYLDNAATTLQKPPCVGQAMLDALEHAGNPGRGAHEPTLHAARIVYHVRETLATLLHAESPDCIAFAANVTQALNTALCGLVRPGLPIAPLVVGGSGVHSFDETPPSQMPTALEAGTLNVPGLAGLGAGVEWILSQGVEALHEKEMALTRLFYEKIVHAPGVKIYGSFDETDRAPIVSLNFGDEDAARAADILWEDYGICVRAGAHCAPLIHKALGTVEQGMVRFSFSHQNTEAEVLKAAEAVCELAKEG